MFNAAWAVPKLCSLHRNMMNISDPDAAAQLGPADKVYDGLGMLAGIIRAYMINVRGCGLEPQLAEPPAETSKAEPETRKRGSYTASPLLWRLPPSRCRGVPQSVHAKRPKTRFMENRTLPSAK